MTEERSRIATGAGEVSAVWDHPVEHASVFVVLAHGAGGTLETPQLKRFARSLAERGIGAVRFNFPYTERGRKTPGSPKEAVAAWRGVADAVRERAPVMILGGKSYGGRMASHLAAEGYPADGLVFLGYPLHAPGRTEQLRDAHLRDIRAPMLFLQGTRDAFARRDLIEGVVKSAPAARLHLVEGADHSFAVPGHAAAEVIDGLAGVTAEWVAALRGALEA